MTEETVLCGRDVLLQIDGKPLLQAKEAEVHRERELTAIRSCFSDETAALVKSRSRTKVLIRGVRFKKPFESCSFADWDHFTLSLTIDGRSLTMTGCEWEDYRAAADEKAFSEHITVRAGAVREEEIG